MNVAIDAARCSGSGNCAYWAPGVFDVGDEGVAVLLSDPAEHADKVRLAAQHCPTAAITIDAPDP